MMIGGRFEPENFLQQPVDRSRLVEIETTHDMRYALQRVVEHANKVIARGRFLAAEDHVAPALGAGGNFALSVFAAFGPRERLVESLDAVYRDPIDPSWNLDSVEGKLFGLGCESYTVGSHEFYLGYALTRKVLLTLDTGHYHPTETIVDKISAVLSFLPSVVLHVSRGVRWDSDHVVVLSDDLESIALELVRGDFLGRTHVGLDFFDASINRVAAWVIGTRNMIKALLKALLEPADKLRAAEASGDYTSRLALLEELKTLPFGAVWDHYCETVGVPPGPAWLEEIKAYERDVQLSRS